jgi:hypothetical protein
MKIFLETNENGNKIYQNLRNTTKATVRLVEWLKL